MGIFGLSMVGLRLFAVIAQAFVIFVTGLMAWELGGKRWAQIAAAIAVALSPLPLFEGTEFQYTTFDYLWWVLIAYFVIRLLKSEDPRWCLALGAAIGIGFETKYTMAFYVTGIVVGFLLTKARRILATKWFWAGVGLAFLIALPNLLWQIRHDFISLHFLQHIHKRDVGEGRAAGFWPQQFWLCANAVAAPLWTVGLIAFFRNSRYRMLAWMYVVPAAILWLSKGRGYYSGAVYPMLFAMGAVAVEHWLAHVTPVSRKSIQAAYLVALIGCGAYFSAVIIPFASSGPLRTYALKNNGDLREEIGWNELVKTVAGIWDSLPPEQRQSAGILVANYGERGAIEILGSAYGLPVPINGTNSAWYRGYPTPPPSTLIVIGFSREDADATFSSCQFAGHNGNSLGVKNEESSDHPDIFLCGGPRLPWPEFWKHFQWFG
ncbi:MAG TPA: glycosyltransferase family 39 protein [Terriglobales bacterium]|nr:glycosyltransferase family 39 protein [Terriglobales bacterium]